MEYLKAPIDLHKIFNQAEEALLNNKKIKFQKAKSWRQELIPSATRTK